LGSAKPAWRGSPESSLGGHLVLEQSRTENPPFLERFYKNPRRGLASDAIVLSGSAGPAVSVGRTFFASKMWSAQCAWQSYYCWRRDRRCARVQPLDEETQNIWRYNERVLYERVVVDRRPKPGPWSVYPASHGDVFGGSASQSAGHPPMNPHRKTRLIYWKSFLTHPSRPEFPPSFS